MRHLTGILLFILLSTQAAYSQQQESTGDSTTQQNPDSTEVAPPLEPDPQWSPGDKRGYIPDNTRKLIPGDIISFQVFEDEDPAIQKRVSEDGYLDLPYVGRFYVEGRTCKQVADDLQLILIHELEYYKNATVFLGLEHANPVRGKITVVGEVNRPGEVGIPAVGDFTVSKAILAAGGFNAKADKEKVEFYQHSTGNTNIKAVIVNVEAIFNGDRSFDPEVKPGDHIKVIEDWFRM